MVPAIQPAFAAKPAACSRSLYVRDLGDNGGKAQLRAALAAVCDGGLVRIRAGSLLLHQGELRIDSKTVTVAAQPPGSLVTIDAQGNSRVLAVGPAATATLLDITLTGGNASTSSPVGYGGGVLNYGSLTLNGASSVTGSVASIAAGGPPDGYGGGIANYGRLVVTGSANVSANTADYGGGIYAFDGSVSLGGTTTVKSNVARDPSPYSGGSGGGIYTVRASLVISGSASVASNFAAGSGGGIHNGGILELAESASVYGNEAVYGGGGIMNGGTVTIAGISTVTGNRSREGAGIYMGRGEVTVGDSASVANNIATHGGGGVWVNDGGTLRLGGSALVGGNSGAYGGGILNNASHVVLEGSATVAENLARAGSTSWDGNGAGIYNNGGATLVLSESSSIVGNQSGQRGGGLYNGGGVAPRVTLNGAASISGNVAASEGGGIYNSNGVVTLNDTASVSDNDPDNCVGTSACLP